MKKARKTRLIWMICLACTALLSLTFAVSCGEPKEVRLTIMDGDQILREITQDTGSELSVSLSKTGYTFGGYFSDEELTQSGAVPEKMPAEDTVLYTRWTPHTYTVRFDGGRGLGWMDPVSAVYDQYVTLPQNAFTLKNETFEGWAAEEGSGTPTYADGVRVRNLTAEDNGEVTLYAVFDVFDLNHFTIADGTVTGYTGSASKIRLPAAANKVATGAFKDCRTLTKVVVPDHYTEIGKGAFEGCTKLASLTLPFVGGSAYEDSFLAYLFGAATFEDNYFKVKPIPTVSGITMDEEFFKANSKLYVPESLKTVIVTGRVGQVAEGAFYMCYGLENVVFTDYEDLTLVGDRAFYACPLLGANSTISAPNRLHWLRNVTEIGEEAFSAYLTERTDEGSQYILTSLYELSPLDEIVTIRDNAFYAAIRLKNLQFGDQLREIGKYAFYSCSSLTRLTFPDSLLTVGEFAFADTSSITSVTFGAGIQAIDNYAFGGCRGLYEAIFHADAVPRMGKGAFSNGINADREDLFDKFRIFVDASKVEEYRSAYPAYADFVKVVNVPKPDAYFVDSWDRIGAKLSFTEGWVVYVTDPDSAFSSRLSYVEGFIEAMGTEYGLLAEEITEVTGRQGEEKFYELAHPNLVLMGDPFTARMRLRSEVFRHEGADYSVYMANLTFIKDQKVGTTDGPYYVEVDEFKHANIYSVSGNVRTPVEMPAGAIYMDFFDTEFQAAYRAVYYDGDMNTVLTQNYVLIGGRLYLNEGEGVSASYELDSSTDTLRLSRDGSAELKVTLPGASYATTMVGTYAGQVGGDRASLGLTLRDNYTASVVLDGLEDGDYHRCTVVITRNDAEVTSFTLYLKSGKAERYDNLAGRDSYLFYQFPGKSVAFADYRTSEGTEHGSLVPTEEGFRIGMGGQERTAVISDRRGSFRIGDTLYSRYDYYEDNTFNQSESFMGDTYVWYSITMDGYGRAAYTDNLELKKNYEGTYYMTDRVVGQTPYGSDLYEFVFEGTCTDAGFEEERITAYFVPELVVSDDPPLIAVVYTGESRQFTVVDSLGFKIMELTLDNFGTVTLKKYTYTLDDRDMPTYTQADSQGDFVAAYFNTLTEELMYFGLYDADGTFRAWIKQDESGDWVTEDGEGYERGESVSVQPDFSKLVPISK